jgi:two-component system sensor histidine kinase DctS
MRARGELLRLEQRDAALHVLRHADNPGAAPLFNLMQRRELSVDTEFACAAARREASPLFSRSYFVPQADGKGLEVLDLCLPVFQAGEVQGFLVGTFGLPQLLENLLPPRRARRAELSVIESDGARLARSGALRGAGVFVAERVVDLPGNPLRLRLDSSAGRPSLIPNLTLALVLGLSVALLALVLALARDTRRRAEAERALAEALAVRKAMEDSLVTGLRARNLEGELIHANPAFRAMVGFASDEMRSPLPPYWPPEQVELYRTRQNARRAAGAADAQREGFETVFMRRTASASR